MWVTQTLEAWYYVSGHPVANLTIRLRGKTTVPGAQGQIQQHLKEGSKAVALSRRYRLDEHADFLFRTHTLSHTAKPSSHQRNILDVVKSIPWEEIFVRAEGRVSESCAA